MAGNQFLVETALTDLQSRRLIDVREIIHRIDEVLPEGEGWWLGCSEDIIAEAVQQTIRWACGGVASDGVRVWAYHTPYGCWELIPESKIDALVFNLAKRVDIDDKRRDPTKNRLRSIRYMVAVGLADKGVAFVDALPGIATNSGFLTASKQDGAKMLDNSARNWALNYMDIDYQVGESYPCPLPWLQFLGQILDKEDIPAVLEFMGVCMLGAVDHIQSALWLYGPGGSGKSTLVNILARLFPQGTVGRVSISDFGDATRRIGLYGKLLNVSNEVAEKRALQSEHYKNICEGGNTFGKLLYKDNIEFRVQSGTIVTCNDIPPVGDKTDGFWRRSPIIEVDTASFHTSDGRRDERSIWEELEPTAQVMRQHLLTRGAECLARPGVGLSLSQAARDFTKRMVIEGDPVAEFYEARCETSLALHDQRPVYDAFVEFCKAAGKQPVNRTKFGRRLQLAVDRSEGAGSYEKKRSRVEGEVTTTANVRLVARGGWNAVNEDNVLHIPF